MRVQAIHWTRLSEIEVMSIRTGTAARSAFAIRPPIAYRATTFQMGPPHPERVNEVGHQREDPEAEGNRDQHGVYRVTADTGWCRQCSLSVDD